MNANKNGPEKSGPYAQPLFLEWETKPRPSGHGIIAFFVGLVAFAAVGGTTGQFTAALCGVVAAGLTYEMMEEK